MTTLYITEYSQLSQNPDSTPVCAEPNNAEQTVAIGATSAQSSAFKSNTQFLRLQSDSVCSIALGSNPTAVATAHRVPANVIEIVKIPMNSGWKIATITNT